MSTVTELTTDSDFTKHLSSLPPTALLILSFHTPWAAPCAQMSTVLSTLAASYPATTPPSTSWISLNAEELPDISDTYDVTAVPFLVLIRAGEVLETVSGSDATKVRTAIEKHAKTSTSAPKASTFSETVTIASPKAHNGTASKGTNLSDYAPSTSDSKTTPEVTSSAVKEDLHTRLEGLVKAAPVMLFMKGTPSSPQCGFSRQLVALLRENGVRYGFFNILADDEVRQGLKEFADWPTFPQLWIDGELVGGLDIVKEEITNNPAFLADYQVKKETNSAAAPTTLPTAQAA